MEDQAPIACSLTAADLVDRQAAWLKVGAFSIGSKEIPGGLAFAFSPAAGVYDSLAELVRLEAECCAWMSFKLDRVPQEVLMTVTAATDDGQTAVRDAFAPLVEVGERAF